MGIVTDTFNGLALKLGVTSKLLKLLLVILILPIGMALLGTFLLVSKIASIGGKLRRWVVSETGLILLVLVSAIWLGYANWTAYDSLQERHVAIAAGSRTSENYRLARALQTVSARHALRLSMAILEIEDAAGKTGMLERGVVQLAIVPDDFPAGPSARSVAVLSSSPPRLLLARSDVDERIVYALTQVLTQFSGEIAAATQEGKAAEQPLAVKIQKPVVKTPSAAPLHAGAAAFYDRDQIRFVFRYPKLTAHVLAGLVLVALWTWVLLRRLRGASTIPTMREFNPAEQAPWTFSRILVESVGRVPPPITTDADATGQGQGWLFRRFRRR